MNAQRDTDNRPERWHVGKEIPIALIVTIVMSLASGVWYASKTDARITVIEERMVVQSQLRDDVLLLKEQLRNLDRQLERLNLVLDRLDDNGPKTDREMFK